LPTLTDATYIDAGNANFTFGGAAPLLIRSGTPAYPDEGSGGPPPIGLLKIDLRGIPARTPAAPARIIVFIEELTSYGMLDIHRIGRLGSTSCPWTDGAVTWNTAPVIHHTPEPGTATLLTAGTFLHNDFITFDVTSLVQDWLSGVWPQ